MASILFVNKASFHYPGGAETRIREVAIRLAGAGHHVGIICGRTQPSDPPIAIADGVTIRTVPVLPAFLLRYFPPPHYLPQALFYFLAWPYILYYLRKWRVDIIRDDMSPFPGLSWLGFVLKRTRNLTVHILFGSYREWHKFYPAPYALAGAVSEFFLLRGWLGYHCIVTDAPWLASYIRRRGASSIRVQYVPNAVDVDSFVARLPRGIITRLVNISRYTQHKQQRDLLEACRLLRKNGRTLTVDMYGGGPLETDLRRQAASANITDCVHIHPALPYRQLTEQLCTFDLFVLTSRSEGFPVILLEAMAASVPCIVARMPYLDGFLKSGIAALYDPEDPEGLANAIAWAQDHPKETESMATLARAWVEQFTWDRTTKEELILLEQAMKSAASSIPEHKLMQ